MTTFSKKRSYYNNGIGDCHASQAAVVVDGPWFVIRSSTLQKCKRVGGPKHFNSGNPGNFNFEFNLKF